MACVSRSAAEDSSLRVRARNAGVAASYTDIAGRRRRVPQTTLRAVLAALAGGETETAKSRIAAPVLASFEPGPVRVRVSGRTQGRVVRWQVEHLEGKGRGLHGEGVDWLDLGALPCGYYRLTLALGRWQEVALLVRAPARAWQPPSLGHTRRYGLSVQLYELLGRQSIGIGDFSDLAALGCAAARMGVDALGINPLHALYLSVPEHASPYSPNSRLAFNPLYLDVRRLPGMDGELLAELSAPSFVARMAALNAQPLIDYAGVAREKLALARAAFRRFRAAGDARGFNRYCRRIRAGIRTWSEFELIAAAHGSDTRRWPSALARRETGPMRRFVGQRRDEQMFYLWLQWQADAQLAEASDAVRNAGMGLGIYHDLALGADAGGAEVWAGGADYVRSLAVGAPPDPLNPRGQNWGFPPLHPQRLMQSGLRSFVELIRANMQHAAALRIDHVLGLNRLFVIPEKADPEQGTYLRYPFEALLAVIALESHRARCLVIGEDLGTVPRGLRTHLARRGIYSLRLLYFEQTEGHRPRPPDEYPRNSLAAVGSHDLPPLAGWWQGGDLARMDRLDLWPSPEARAQAHAARPVQRAALSNAFQRLQLRGFRVLPPAEAAYRWLARSRSRLMMIQPEDLLGISDPVNVPGTVGEEPNWRRRRLPPWPQWLADPRFAQVLRAVQSERVPHRAVATPEPPPIATYRMQLNADFGFRDAAGQVAYLRRLGISHLYLSPVLTAVPGSAHGYDVVDPSHLDPERGGEAGFAVLCAASAGENLRLLVDLVPNHMGAHAANPWWMDLLEWGRRSAYAGHFDVDWAAGDGRLVVPVLGAPLETLLANGEIGIEFSATGRFCVRYAEHSLPVAPESAAVLLAAAARRLPETDGEALGMLSREFHGLTRLSADTRRAAGLALQGQLATLATSRAVHQKLDAVVRSWSDDAEHLSNLLARQHWRVAYWREGLEEINYRRFFDIASLAAVRLERPEVFAAAHERVRELVARHDVAGLRIDHVDGLASPGRYLAELTSMIKVCHSQSRVWVEKVLGEQETLPSWPVSGTTGYEFLNDVTRLLLSTDGEALLLRIWNEVSSGSPPFSEVLAAAKRETVQRLLSPMVDRVTRSLMFRAPVPFDRLREALVAAIVALPVYRAYPDVTSEERTTQRGIVEIAAQGADRVDATAGDWLRRVLGAPFVRRPPRLPARLRDGATRFWQLAATAMAKGLEDTALYRDFAVLALNEVGGDPQARPLEVAGFHQRMQIRAARWPTALNASATHDTKRGEDARMRLVALAAHAAEWRTLIPQLHHAARDCGRDDLYAADEYLVWQTLLAVWPPPCHSLSASASASLRVRVQDYLVKALREGKTRSSWLEPAEDYENAVTRYARCLVGEKRGRAWRESFLPFAARVARTGALASLAALTLKLTAPGIPDVYQGTELWDLALVDPDNRRPVDYAGRLRALDALMARSGKDEVSQLQLVNALLRNWHDGRVKLHVLATLLALRQRRQQVFADGGYHPLSVDGAQADSVVAFQRGEGTDAVIVAIAHLPPESESASALGLKDSAWDDTVIKTEWGHVGVYEVLTGRRFNQDSLRASEVFSPLPAAVFLAR